MTKYKTDIFAALNAINVKNLDYFDNLPEGELKELSTYLLLKFMGSSYDPAQIVLLNEYVNLYGFTLQKHKKLLIQLMSICTNGEEQRYKMLKSKKENKNNIIISVIREYYGYSEKEAKMAIPILKKNDILKIAEITGIQKEEITKLNKELKDIGK